MMLLTIVTLNAICCFRSKKDEIAANNYEMHNQYNIFITIGIIY